MLKFWFFTDPASQVYRSRAGKYGKQKFSEGYVWKFFYISHFSLLKLDNCNW